MVDESNNSPENSSNNANSANSLNTVLNDLTPSPVSKTTIRQKGNSSNRTRIEESDDGIGINPANIDFSEYENMSGHEKVLDLIVKKDDVTWKTIILELVNSDKMDPWNVDIGELTKGYMVIIKNLKVHDFRVSGKMILAAAMLLKLKSIRLLEGDINELDRLFSSANEVSDDNDLGMVDEPLATSVRNIDIHKLIPRTPQPRKRKVSIYDLVDALEKALEVKERRLMRRMPSLEVEYPRKKMDVSILMGHLYDKIKFLFSSERNKVLFTDLTPSHSREDKVITFIPLLHLTNQRKVDLDQDDHFGPIEVMINENNRLEEEINDAL